ncbi:hypothetical protein HAV22_01115 [Massilia sp. TW-1]|uniref:AMP-dependent synthetase/ligase domain-containing protein n=1 Tax=Telluria antibiotica TaxID=2717319 RepID=A0ABX0P6N5_9BURK|nr:hypothetical protein [Telluria antibiotica]NIA52254.1 hypothetical protein [Telluria antibiotica]
MTRFGDLLDTTVTDVDAASEAVHADTILKFLFTSGSTKQPKAVVTTHGMLAHHQQMLLHAFPFLGEAPPVEFARTLDNLREIAPTVYFNVPKGVEMLTEALERDAALRATFFSRVKLFLCAGAGCRRSRGTGSMIQCPVSTGLSAFTVRFPTAGIRSR